MKIDEVIKWIKENYDTVQLPRTLYTFKGDYSDTLDRCICIVKKSDDKNEYHKRYSVSVEQFCEQLKNKFKDE